MPGEFESILTKLQGKLGKQTIRRASTINRPRPKLNVIQIKAINDFVKRNPRADGGSVNGSEQAAFRAKVEELMDDGYDFGEAVREAMRQGYDDGGRVGFYKGSLVTEGPNKGKYKVKFPGKSNASNYPNNFVGTQFGSEDEINKLITDRKEFTAKNIKAKINPEKQLGEKTLKSLIDDTFAKKDFKNFKIKLTPSIAAAAKRKGLTRTDTGGKIPQQYLTKFNKAIEAGPGSDLFKSFFCSLTVLNFNISSVLAYFFPTASFSDLVFLYNLPFSFNSSSVSLLSTPPKSLALFDLNLISTVPLGLFKSSSNNSFSVSNFFLFYLQAAFCCLSYHFNFHMLFF